ncbi:MAG: endo-1,4-beta-xylanase, partial [Bacteroidetes bacterium]|nr:endo-1,4-beta-xylanase [Bacteroidota bacterium]
IRLCAEHCPKAAMVDVVNEPLEDVPQGLNPVPYYKALGGAGSTGWDWVITAFTLARKYFPNAKLLLNDYFILSSNPNNQQAPVFQYRHIIDLLKQRNLIDGIGCEGHFLEGVDSSTIRANLDSLAVAGLPIYITEYDVDESNDATQLGIYEQQFPVFWTDPAVKGVTLWGYIQGYVWRTDAYLIRSDGTARPALTWLIQYVSNNPAGVKQLSGIPPTSYSLGQNYPNPFNPTTMIHFALPSSGHVTLRVYDILGRIVETLVDGVENAGEHSVSFNGAGLASGVYFYRLQAGDRFLQKKMMLIK